MNKPFSIDFSDIEDYLDNLFINDDRAKDIIDKCGFSKEQLNIINTIVISALKAYDLKKQK